MGKVAARERAYTLEDRIHHKTAESRWNKAMAVLQELSEEFNQAQVGKTIRVLVETPGSARTHMDAPDIDGTVFVDKKLPVAKFADVTVKDWRGYDLVANR